jgi:acetyl esterase/lipase
VTITRDVAYGSGPDQLLDVYEPAGDGERQRPLVVWVHGGAFTGGDKTLGPMIRFPTDFARAGYVAASIEYRRLAAQNCVDPRLTSANCVDAARAAISDAQTAVRFLRANAATYGIDPDRIAIAGESAGGIAAAGVATESTGPDDRVQAWVAVSAGAIDLDAIDAGDAPGLLFAGTNDSFISYQFSVDTEQAMQRAGVPVVLRTLEGENHVPAEKFGDYFVADSKAFLHEHLDLDGAYATG